MDVTTLLEPKIDLEHLAKVLDTLGHAGRMNTIYTWSPKQKRALYEAAKGFRPVTAAELVGDCPGQNTLALFSHMEKRFAKVGDSFIGYNPNAMRAFIGDGYFSVDEKDGEVVIDYTRIPKDVPAGWPAPKDHSGIGSIVYGGQIDYLRALSSHVYIGSAFKNGKERGAWFAIAHKTPS